MSEILQGLLDHLRDLRGTIVRSVEIKGQRFDPTYGPQSFTEWIEVIDFDQLLKAMDEFAATFKQE